MKLRTTSFGLARAEGHPSADAFAVHSWDQTAIAVLSDGAGSGLPAREASHRAVASLVENYRVRPRNWAPQRALEEFARLLNRSLYQESLARFQRCEMVATLAVVVIEGDHLFGLNVGDSRVYLWRDGTLQTLSVDHVDVQHKHLLNRALGMAGDIEFHSFSMPLENDDVVMLCSDGVWNHLGQGDLEEALRARSSATHIVEMAQTGSRPETVDDMSAVVIDLQQTGKLRAMTDRHLTIPKELKKGDRVDGYELLRSFQDTNRVWLAEQSGNRFVLKFAPAAAIESEVHLDAFTRETWNATRLQSEHFVRAFEPPGQTMRYYVMEFVDAPNLHAVLEERVLSVDSAIGLGKFLAQANQILLQFDLVHGDIKPENILCIGDYSKLSFKLVDLGSSSEIFSVSSRAGTASYLAPEIFHSAPRSERTEIFAMGVTLYKALTKVLAYGEIERFQSPTFAAAKPITRLNPNVPPWLEVVIMLALAVNPERRYQHYSEMIFDLENPTTVRPLFDNSASLLERNPLAFYKVGFFLLLITVVCFLLHLLSHK